MRKNKSGSGRISKLSVYILLSYVLLSVALYFIFQTLDSKGKVALLFFYSMLTQILLYGLGYIALRNWNLYILWLLIGVAHLNLYWHLETDPQLEPFKVYPLVFPRNTLFLLLLFQLLRAFSFLVQKQDLVVPERDSEYDFYRERKVSIWDKTFLTLYFICVFGLPFVQW